MRNNVYSICEMTSLSMTSVRFYLNEAAKCVETHNIAGLLMTHPFKIQNGDDIWPNLSKILHVFMAVKDLTTWKELSIDDCAKDGGKEFLT